MKLKSFLFIVLIPICLTYGQSQISDFKEKFELPTEVKETSGLLFLDGKIITHNDSGDGTNLYEIDSLSGNLLRTISISNATNVDWEDIAQNNTHIFIADIGNNNGNRQNLKIYKILKSEFKNNNTVSAEIITFNYEDQTDFSSQPNSSNFDAEGLVTYGNDLLIFTKNWADLKTNVYKIPLITGNYVALKVSSANVEGLITGAVYTSVDKFFLTGYNTSLIPFLIYIDFNRMPGDDIFFSGFKKISLENELGQGSQVEAITDFGNAGKYYISRENFTTTFAGSEVSFTQKLYEFYDTASPLLSIESNKLSLFKISPNPIIDKLNIDTNLNISKIEVYNSIGKKIYSLITLNQREIDISTLSMGVYYLKFQFKDSKTIVKKIIKF